MSKIIDDLHERSSAALDDMKHIEDTWGSDRSAWPTGQVERYDRQNTSLQRFVKEIEDLESGAVSRAERIEAIRSQARPDLMERGFDAPSSTSRTRTDPWGAGEGDDILRMDSPTGLATRAQDAIEVARGFSPAARELLSNVASRDDNQEASAFIIAATSDAYRSAFGKILSNPQRGHLLWSEQEREAYARVETLRASMSLTDANGGYLVPFVLDPTINFTNSGTASFIRSLANVQQTTSKDWNGVTSAGVTAEHLAENAAATDASPTFSRVTVPMIKSAAWLTASYEIFEDSNIAAQIPALIADARARLEATDFTVGNGTTAPMGVITEVVATTASRVSATTGGSYGVEDVWNVWDAITPRARQSSKAAWLANNSIITRTRRFGTSLSAAFWADLNEATPPALIGKPIYEASDMTSSVTTGTAPLLLGDFSQFFIVDRLGTTLTEMPMLTDTDGKPTFGRGWAVHWRSGSKVANTAAFRILRL